ncbi:hypothetical protein PTD2_05605 [Pseudoalteromonas tunicata D2]|uniref:Uncharacterized protein n=1 Tax=Pseudoalteromonas tunicata D2 TaxID=87626 RepID=A4CDS9_9GAMM|nr:hypothetical protein PTD2_05605 [Pseudoalteromonas tunicata D2]
MLNKIKNEGSKMKNMAGYLFISSGAAFFVAAYVGQQLALLGVGVMMVVLGLVNLRKQP